MIEQGPIMLPDESSLHLFFECKSVRKIMDHTISEEWSAKAALQPTFVSITRYEKYIKKTLNILHNIWRCRKPGLLPTRTRLMIL